MQPVIDWITAHAALVLAATTLASEALALLPTKANSITEVLVSLLKSLLKYVADFASRRPGPPAAGAAALVVGETETAAGPGVPPGCAETRRGVRRPAAGRRSGAAGPCPPPLRGPAPSVASAACPLPSRTCRQRLRNLRTAVHAPANSAI